jgi:hypothetical protein
MMMLPNAERTSHDKILAKNDIEEIRKIIRKNDLSREDMLDLQYMIAASESKLWNLDEWQRYILLKYFAIIGDFGKNMEILYDYRDRLQKEKKQDMLPEDTRKLLENAQALGSHNMKFLVDFYLNIARTSLSVGAVGFMEILKNKFEMVYTDPKLTSTEPEKRHWWGGKAA